MTTETKPDAAGAGPRIFNTTNLAVLVLVAGLATALYLVFGNSDREVTEDAYVEGNVVQVTPQLSGSVIAIGADNTDYVEAGQTLVQFNPVDARLALARAASQLSKAVRQVRAQFAASTQMNANVTLRRTDLARAEADLARRGQLASSGAISGEDIHHAEDSVKTARAALTVAEQQALSSLALVDRTTILDHPDVQAAASQLRDAYVATVRTTLRAPVSGIVTKRNVQLGQRINAGTALMSIVPQQQMWINANFKESQLRHIRIGQPVRLTADVYGADVEYRGRVVGQDAGTGSAFALMPAQNATGNWIKIVQRVPVRIALEPAQLAAHPLKLGLSMHVTVDTLDRSGPVAMAKTSARPAYTTAVFEHELADAEQLVQSTIAANLAGPGRTH